MGADVPRIPESGGFESSSQGRFDPSPPTSPSPPTAPGSAGAVKTAFREHGYNRRMTPSTVPNTGSLSISSADPFAGLTPTDATRIEAAMSAAIADSTRAVYTHAWRAWERWCTTRQITAPPSPTRDRSRPCPTTLPNDPA